METKRIKVIPKNPNPLFKQWLSEWIEDADKKKKRSSKTYQRALDSLNKYPLTLGSGFDCAILENVGPKICQMLDERLEEHLKARPDLLQQTCFKDKISELQRREALKVSDLINNVEAACLTDCTFTQELSRNNIEDIVMPELSFHADVSEDEVVPEVERDVEIPEELLSSSAESEDSFDRLIRKHDPEVFDKQKKKLKKQPSQPPQDNLIRRQKRVETETSAPHSKLSQLTNSPLSTAARGLRSFKKFNTFGGGSNLGGPSYASSPVSKFLDVETHTLSPTVSTARSKDDDDEFDRLASKYDPISPIPVISKKPPRKLIKATSNLKLTAIAENSEVQQPSTTKRIPEEVEDEIKYISIDDINPADFNVKLLVDIAETTGKTKANQDDVVAKLTTGNVSLDVRKLHVGDFLWIAQHKVDKSNEFVLPYIIERKRLDDLSQSIKDGRFHEQKFRLKQCGVENVIYLIENHGSGKSCGLPFETLLQAATNTQIHTKFQVKFTENCQHTVLYLTLLTSFIENIFRNKGPIKLKMMEFELFNQSAVKNRKFSVRETFIKQLLALKGLSVDMALEITKFYPTPTDLIKKYQRLDQKEGEILLTKITIGDIKRKITAPVSKQIFHFYTRDKL